MTEGNVCLRIYRPFAGRWQNFCFLLLSPDGAQISPAAHENLCLHGRPTGRAQGGQQSQGFVLKPIPCGQLRLGQPCRQMVHGIAWVGDVNVTSAVSTSTARGTTERAITKVWATKAGVGRPAGAPRLYGRLCQCRGRGLLKVTETPHSCRGVRAPLEQGKGTA